MSNLFKPIKVGNIELSHRVVLPPLTRLRSPDHIPNDLVAEYYEQRAAEPGSLLITEGSFITPASGGLPNVPGHWNEAQVAGWTKVVEKVHAKKSFIFSQLWALGRAAVPAVLEAEGGLPLVSASNIPLSSAPDAIPRPLTVEEIDEYVAAYATAATNFVTKAGGDGVEVHSANGYLLDQFLQKNSNKRTDDYGGSVENRTRFTLRAVEAAVNAVGQERVGIRLSPFSTFQDMCMEQDDIVETFSYLVSEIKRRWPRFAYIHCIERIGWSTPQGDGKENYLESLTTDLDFIEKIWSPKPFIAAGGYTPELALKKTEKCDNFLVSFGRYFIANPDIVKKIKNGTPLTKYNRATFYTPGPEGYTDYPTSN